MTDLQRYLVEEIALDHADGLITRREALRRLALVGIGLSAASSLLAALVAEQARAGSAPTAAPPPRGAAVAPRDDTDHLSRARRTQADGRLGEGAKPRGGVLVIHENRGLTDHIRSVANRFAPSGYSALALDLLSEEGGTGSFPDEAAAMAALYGVPGHGSSRT